MANFYGFARSNYFKVRDQAAFRQMIHEIGSLEVITNDERVALLAQGSNDGCFPSHRSFDPPDEPAPAWVDDPRFKNGIENITRSDPQTDENMKTGGPVQDVDFWLPGLVAAHLEPGQIAVFMEAGAEKLRYISGWAIAIDSTGESVELTLNDIYQAAEKKFGVKPTEAAY